MDNGKAMDIFVSAVDLQRLGLPEDTPQELLKEVISTLQGMTFQSDGEKEIVAKQSRLFRWLDAAASVSTISSSLVQFVKSLG